MTDAQNQSRPRRSRKNPNGQGSVYQRADGLWIGAAYVLTATGHRRRITVSSRSEKEAARKLRDKITQSDKGIPVAGESWTVQQYFGYWLEHMVKVKRPKTYQGYEGIVRRYPRSRARPPEARTAYSSGRLGHAHTVAVRLPLLP
jgi:hypothetical protein